MLITQMLFLINFKVYTYKNVQLLQVLQRQRVQVHKYSQKTQLC